MRFTSQLIEAEAGHYWETMVFDENDVRLYWAWTRENSEVHFMAEFITHYEEKPDEVEHLVCSSLDLVIKPNVESGAEESYDSFVRGMLRFLERDEGSTLREQWQSDYWLLKRYPSTSLSFWFCPRRRYFLFYTAEKQLLPSANPATNDDDDEKVYRSSLTLAYRGEDTRGNVFELIERYTDFQNSIPAGDTVSLRSFVNFSRGLVQFLNDERAGLGIYTTRIPQVCSFIVKNEEEDFERQKLYLGLILSTPLSEDEKVCILNEVVDDIERDHGAGSYIMYQVVSLISEHYLSIYDLDSSARFWKRTGGGDLFLRFFVSLHENASRYLAGVGILMGLLSLVAALNVFQCVPVWLDELRLPTMNLAIWVLIFLHGLAGVIVAGVAIKAYTQSLLYSQLFLPRLLGASVVGLTPLLLDDLPWKIGLLSDPVNWGLVCLYVYLSSLIYIFIEVYNTVKFVRGRTIKHAWSATWKIFSVALVETLFIVVVASSLFFPVVNLMGNKWGINWGIKLWPAWHGFSFGFFPALIILWTGIALFVGSFVQLLWQERRITSSV
jgi:hypothetical protein